MESKLFISSTWKNVNVFPVTKTIEKAVYVISAPLRDRVKENARLFGFGVLENTGSNELVINF